MLELYVGILVFLIFHWEEWSNITFLKAIMLIL